MATSNSVVQMEIIYFFLHFPKFLGMLQSFKAGHIHGVHTDAIIFTEPLGCLACLYSWVGEPHTL